MGAPMDTEVLRGRPSSPGYTSITRIGEPGYDTGISFGILRLAPGERIERVFERETAVLLMDGTIAGSLGEVRFETSRASLFDETPVALHASRGAPLRLSAVSAVELALFEAEAESDGVFEPLVFDRSTMAELEQRGKGMLDDASYRLVRTIFDLRNRPQAALVLGEVVTLPGRWSSYPPHHHPQPEIYHYRFDRASGFGFSQLGGGVVRIGHGDTLKIPPGADHAQVAAPGYPMYYLWVIRHLPHNPYRRPEFTESHRWLMDPLVKPWRPKEDAP